MLHFRVLLHYLIVLFELLVRSQHHLMLDLARVLHNELNRFPLLNSSRKNYNPSIGGEMRDHEVVLAG